MIEKKEADQMEKDAAAGRPLQLTSLDEILIRRGYGDMIRSGRINIVTIPEHKKNG
jgi:hypothetical protein